MIRSVPPASIVFKKIDSTLRGHTAIEIAASLDAFACDAAVVCPAFPANGRVVRDGYLAVSNSADFVPIHVATQISCRHAELAELEAAIAGGARVVSVDASCDGDLAAVARAIRALPYKILWAGSAGLARALAGQPICGCPLAASELRVVFAIGSDHPVTLAQLQYLHAQRPDAPVLRLPYGQVSSEEVRRMMERTQPQALFLSGGATASLVCRAIGARSIDLHEEIMPGIPLGTLRGGPCDGIPVVTKSGGFGPCDALIRIADYFYGPGSYESKPQ